MQQSKDTVTAIAIHVSILAEPATYIVHDATN